VFGLLSDRFLLGTNTHFEHECVFEYRKIQGYEFDLLFLNDHDKNYA